MPIFFYPAAASERHVAGLAARDAVQASAQARRSQSAVEHLEARLERLALVTEALWTILRERVGISDLDLLDRIREVDLSDGALDGKVRHGVLDCPECGRVLSKRNARCLYCGVEVDRPPFSDI